MQMPNDSTPYPGDSEIRYVRHVLDGMMRSAVEADFDTETLTLVVSLACADGVVTLMRHPIKAEQLPFFHRVLPTRADVLQNVVDTALPELAKIRMKETP